MASNMQGRLDRLNEMTTPPDNDAVLLVNFVGSDADKAKEPFTFTVQGKRFERHSNESMDDFKERLNMEFKPRDNALVAFEVE